MMHCCNLLTIFAVLAFGTQIPDSISLLQLSLTLLHPARAWSTMTRMSLMSMGLLTAGVLLLLGPVNSAPNPVMTMHTQQKATKVMRALAEFHYPPTDALPDFGALDGSASEDSSEASSELSLSEYSVEQSESSNVEESSSEATEESSTTSTGATYDVMGLFTGVNRKMLRAAW